MALSLRYKNRVWLAKEAGTKIGFENTPALKIQSRSGISKIRFCQPRYLGIINLNVNFGAISTLDEKVALFT